MATPLSLDAHDRQLLVALEAQPDAPVTQLAAQTGLSARSAGRRLERLFAANVVRVLGRTLPTFGGRVARLYRVEGAREQLEVLGRKVAKLAASRSVRLSQDGSELSFGLVIAGADDDAPLSRVLNTAGLRRVRAYELLDVRSRAANATARPTVELDEVDERILGLVAEAGRRESSSIARQLGLDASTVARRRRRLMEEGILYLETDVDPAALHLMGEALLWVAMAPGRISQLAQNLRQLPEVRFAAVTGGTSAVVANVFAADRAGLVAFIDEHLDGYGVTGVETTLLGKVFKRASGALPRMRG